MGQYVFNKELESPKPEVKVELDIFQESETEFRPIVTASDESFGSGFSNRRSFPSQEAAMEFFDDNETDLVNEAVEDLQKSA